MLIKSGKKQFLLYIVIMIIIIEAFVTLIFLTEGDKKLFWWNFLLTNLFFVACFFVVCFDWRKKGNRNDHT